MAEFLPLADAVAAHVADGACVALEGFTHLIPFAAGHELIRQGRRELHLVRMTPDLIYDQLIGVGAARKLTFSWGGNPGVGSLHRLRDAVENQWPRALEIDEHSHAAMAVAYRAGAARLPFGIFRGYLGTDLVQQNPRIRSVRCPYTGEELATVPAVNPDVTILHAQRADRRGNVAIARDRRRRPRSGARGEKAPGHGRNDRRRTAARDEQHRSAAFHGHGGLALSRWRLAVLCARSLRARQRFLPPLGCGRARPRRLHGLDRPARSGHRRSQGVPRKPPGGGVSRRHTAGALGRSGLARSLRRRPKVASLATPPALRAPDAPQCVARVRAVAGPPSERMSDLLSERGESRRRSTRASHSAYSTCRKQEGTG